MISTIRDDTLRRLADYRPIDELERRYCDELSAFVRQHHTSHQRSHAEGHVTASAWIVDQDLRHALLVHHRRLQRWLQPGGHIENDTTVLEAALRETREETGLACEPASSAIFDIDIHRIPSNAREVSHLHYDIRFLLVAGRGSTPSISDESHDLRWFSWEEIVAMRCGPSIDRMMRKSQQWAHTPPPTDPSHPESGG